MSGSIGGLGEPLPGNHFAGQIAGYINRCVALLQSVYGE